MTMKTLPKGPFLGINNKLPAYALHVKDKGDYLTDAVNVDVDNAGTLQSRRTAALVQALTAPHSLYQTAEGTFFMVRASVLYEVSLPTYSETLVEVLTSNARMSYVEYDGALYFSNGTDSGRVKSGVVYPLGLPTPDAPILTDAAGTMPAGKYQVCVSYSNSVTGEEGGVSAASTYTLASEAGLHVTLPPATPGATHVNVYVSDINGSVLRRATAVVVGTVYLDVAAKPTGREANRRYEAPLPAGELFLMNGALCSFKGDVIYEGVPYRPGYYVPLNHREPEGGRIRLAGDISNVLPTENGAYVVADKTYWFAGPRLSRAEQVQLRLPYGGVPGTAFRSPDDMTVGWFGRDGVVLADLRGEVRTTMAANVAQDAPVSGVSTVLDVGGYSRVVSCGWCVNLSTGATTRYEDYELTSFAGGYATAADGIYSIENEGDVAWAAALGQEAFGTEAKKRLPATYLGAESAVPITLRVATASGTAYTYASRKAGQGLTMHRVDPGRGMWSSWYDLTLQGSAKIRLASVSFAPTASTRRI